MTDVKRPTPSPTSAPSKKTTMATAAPTPKKTDTKPSPLSNKFSQRFLSRTVKISIGSSPSYHVNHDLLTSTSTYFNRCLSSSFRESREMRVKLDLEPEYVEPLGHYVEHIYSSTGEYTVENSIQITEEIPSTPEQKIKLGGRCISQATLHARVYILGETISSESLKKVALGCLRKCLWVAYDYPPPSKQKGPSWTAVRWKDNSHEYRQHCHRTQTRMVTESIIQLRDLCELIELIYQNTPQTTGCEGMRKAVAQYFVSVIESLREKDKDGLIVDLMARNKDFLADVLRMSCIKNGASLGLV